MDLASLVPTTLLSMQTFRCLTAFNPYFFTGLDLEKVKLDIFLLKTPQTGHPCMFAQVGNKEKHNVCENMSASTM